MTKTFSSRRISSAMASRSASRMVMVTISVPSGIAGSAAAFTSAGATDAFCSFFGAGAAGDFAAGDADSAAFSCCDGFTSFIAPLSSPSLRMTAIGVFTATSAVPSGTRILPSVPSSTASTSIVALSVSISAMTSPDLIESPSFFSHLERLPFSIVGESAGISTSVGMVRYCVLRGQRLLGAVYVGPELGNVRLGIVGGEFGGLVDQIAHLAIDLLQRVFLDELGLEDAVARHVDRIVRRAHLLDLLARAVFGRIRHRVAAIAVGQHLEDERALAGAAPRGRLLAGRLDRAHVHAVDLLARNIERQTALRQVDLGRGARDRRAHGVAIVLDDVDDRQLPELGHVEALVDLALVGGAVAEIGHRDVVVAAIAVGEGEPGAERHLRADDAVAAEEALLDAEHVHRAALALGIAVGAAGELGHDALRVHAGGDHVAVVAIAGDDLVAAFERHLHTDDDRFLADVEVAEAADQTHAVELARLLLEAADGEHRPVGGELLVFAEIGDRPLGLRRV